MATRPRICLAPLLAMVSFAQTEVPIVTGVSATPLERYAAQELSAHLATLYLNHRFPITRAAPSKGPAILLGTPRTMPELRKHVVLSSLSNPDSFVVKAGKGNVAYLAGADPRGALYAVYALLEKLGFGFYLSSTTKPEARAGALTFEEWDLRDQPLFADRLVFDWHNFLSSCSTWELEDWQRYIDNSLRMRFSGIMVHAYGNNPMFTFRFAGMSKPVGFLATTARGRDWGTQHVNDVRRMIGGELFSEPVFGASAAKVAEDQRAPAAVGLMQKVFGHAAARGMSVTFALDLDTESANPQEMIRTLPASARIASGKFHLANPDSPEGYAFYKAQVEQLLAAYPQITRLAVWFRPRRTPWAELKPEQFPGAWKREFHGHAAEARFFAMGKLVAAIGRALRETGHGQVELAAGSWGLEFLKDADRYFPREAALIPLDSDTVFDTAAGQRFLRSVRSGRKLVPIVWAHHDDRTYVGRPYTPFVNFATLLKSSGASGFGIIHWTTRPLDLYFRSTAAQVWQATRDQPLEEACENMAVRTFGPPAKDIGRDYLFAWVTEGPMFGRETTDRFIDVPLREAAAHIKRGKERLAMLARIDAGSLSPQGREFLNYFRSYEEFLHSFFESHAALERAQSAAESGDYAKARQEVGAANPEEVIRAYVRAASQGAPTKGEMGLVVSLNLRWLPFFVSMRQAAGLEPVRVRLGKVEREPLAQAPGNHTFHFDEQGRLWRVVEPEPGAAEISLAGIMGDRLQPGRYSVNGGDIVQVKDGRVTVPLRPGMEEIVLVRVP